MQLIFIAGGVILPQTMGDWEDNSIFSKSILITISKRSKLNSLVHVYHKKWSVRVTPSSFFNFSRLNYCIHIKKTFLSIVTSCDVITGVWFRNYADWSIELEIFLRVKCLFQHEFVQFCGFFDPCQIVSKSDRLGANSDKFRKISQLLLRHCDETWNLGHVRRKFVLRTLAFGKNEAFDVGLTNLACLILSSVFLVPHFLYC